MKKITKVLIISIITVFIMGIAINLYAGEVGRYQAISITKHEALASPEIIILDTKEGYLWKWTSQAMIEGQVDGLLLITYLGKVKPGKKIGDPIEMKLFPKN